MCVCVRVGKEMSRVIVLGAPSGATCQRPAEASGLLGRGMEGGKKGGCIYTYVIQYYNINANLG